MIELYGFLTLFMFGVFLGCLKDGGKVSTLLALICASTNFALFLHFIN
jgi:hypothetical protein